MKQVLNRVIALLEASPTWMVGAATVVTIFSERVADVLPWTSSHTSEQVTAVLVAVASALTAAALIVRRVTPVLAGARGLLPADEKRPVTERELMWRQLADRRENGSI